MRTPDRSKPVKECCSKQSREMQFEAATSRSGRLRLATTVSMRDSNKGASGMAAQEARNTAQRVERHFGPTPTGGKANGKQRTVPAIRSGTCV